MPVLKVKIDSLPSITRETKISKTPEYNEVHELLGSLTSDEAIQITLSPGTVGLFDDEKKAVTAFRQRLTLEHKTTHRVRVRKNQIVVTLLGAQDKKKKGKP